MQQLSAKPEKNKANRFASGKKSRRKKIRDRKSIGLALVYYLSFLYVFLKNERTRICFCCANIRRLSHWIGLPCCVCNSTGEENQPNRNNIDQKQVESGKISFLILRKWPATQRAEGARKKKAPIKKLNRYVPWCLHHSAMISIMIEHSNFAENLCGEFHYLYSMAERYRFSFFALGWALRTRQLFSLKIL